MLFLSSALTFFISAIVPLPLAWNDEIADISNSIPEAYKVKSVESSPQEHAYSAEILHSASSSPELDYFPYNTQSGYDQSLVHSPMMLNKYVQF